MKYVDYRLIRYWKKFRVALTKGVKEDDDEEAITLDFQLVTLTKVLDKISEHYGVIITEIGYNKME
jgi:hypothetical protein